MSNKEPLQCCCDWRCVSFFWSCTLGLLASLLAMLAIAILLANEANLAKHYKANAMDLCAWHARRMHGDDVSSEEATMRWNRIVSGESVCSFCGQKHNLSWISRNAWDSQVHAMKLQ